MRRASPARLATGPGSTISPPGCSKLLPTNPSLPKIPLLADAYPRLVGAVMSAGCPFSSAIAMLIRARFEHRALENYEQRRSGSPITGESPPASQTNLRDHRRDAEARQGRGDIRRSNGHRVVPFGLAPLVLAVLEKKGGGLDQAATQTARSRLVARLEAKIAKIVFVGSARLLVGQVSNRFPACPKNRST
jgi:hypothetical protein